METMRSGSAMKRFQASHTALRMASQSAKMWVGEPASAQILPDILGGVERGRSGRQRQEGGLGGGLELGGCVPSGLIQDEHGVGARSDVGADLIEMVLHALSVGALHDHGRAGLAFRTDGAEQIDAAGAQVGDLADDRT
jgi:hypothetical protein